MTQRTTVIAHLKKFGSISALEARHVYKIERLASRIDELRQSGYAISTTRKRDASGTTYAEYRLVVAAPPVPYVTPDDAPVGGAVAFIGKFEKTPFNVMA